MSIVIFWLCIFINVLTLTLIKKLKHLHIIPLLKLKIVIHIYLQLKLFILLLFYFIINQEKSYMDIKNMNKSTKNTSKLFKKQFNPKMTR